MNDTWLHSYARDDFSNVSDSSSKNAFTGWEIEMVACQDLGALATAQAKALKITGAAAKVPCSLLVLVSVRPQTATAQPQLQSLTPQLRRKFLRAYASWYAQGSRAFNLQPVSPELMAWHQVMYLVTCPGPKAKNSSDTETDAGCP